MISLCCTPSSLPPAPRARRPFSHVDPAPRSRRHPSMKRALVLGGGGITGIAWEIGLLKGLRDLGVNLTDADTVVGTSAGSVVGAQVAGGISLEAMYDAQL